MKRLGKLFPVIVLCAATWLNTYQIVDAATDSVEDMNGDIQVMAGHGLQLSRPVVPDNDDDDMIPDIVDQTLLPFSSILEHVLRPVGVSDIALALAAVRTGSLRFDLQNHSPPSLRLWLDQALVLRQIRFAAARRTLAPPVR